TIAHLVCSCAGRSEQAAPRTHRGPDPLGSPRPTGDVRAPAGLLAYSSIAAAAFPDDSSGEMAVARCLQLRGQLRIRAPGATHRIPSSSLIANRRTYPICCGSMFRTVKIL